MRLCTRGAATLAVDVPPRDRWDRLCSPALDQCNLASYAAAVDDSAVNGASWSVRLYGKVALVCQSGVTFRRALRLSAPMAAPRYR